MLNNKSEVSEPIKNNAQNNQSNMQYEILNIKNDFYLYKYCSKTPEKPYRLINQYFYDNFEKNDLDNAHVIIFIGKTGDGKTTAINAFFNVIKSVKLKEKYRFILIDEKNKNKRQGDSQTDGINLYYIKDYFNNPFIIIDTQGFGDTRGKKYDELLRESFEYIFKNIIKHINIICFIAKSTDNKLDEQTKYIFSAITSLFAKDVSKNFIFLTTFANDITLEDGPIFIDFIKDSDNFNNIIANFDEKWYYVVDSMSILRDTSSNLAKYSYEQLKALYEEKLNNHKNISINNSLKIIAYRFRIKNIIKSIFLLYDNIKNNKNEIHNIDHKLSDYKSNLTSVGNEIKNKKYEIDSVYIINKDFYLDMLKKKRDMNINRLDNQYETKKVRILRYNGINNTYCNHCKSNCHYPCNCFISFIFLHNSCIRFPIFSNRCTYCGHYINNHTIRGKSRWVDETERYKISNATEIERENNEYRKECNKINDAYNKGIDEKNYKQKQLNDLYRSKSNLEKKIKEYLDDKYKLNYNLKNNISKIKSYFIDLLNISYLIDKTALNKFHFFVENEYIKSLIYKIEQIGTASKNNEIKELNENRKYNDIFLEIIKLSEKEINYLSDDNLINKINMIIT